MEIERFPEGSSLRDVSLVNLSYLRELPSFAVCSQIRYFYCHSLPHIEYIHGVGVSPTFNIFKASLCNNLKGIACPSKLEDLREFVLRSCPKLSRYPDFWDSKKLYNLDISHCDLLTRGVATAHWQKIKDQMADSSYRNPSFYLL